MNKKTVDELIPIAHKVLAEVKIAENGVINKTYRGQISTFGSAVVTGSLRAAIAFFSDKGSAGVDRRKLMVAILQILQEKEPELKKFGTLFEYAEKNPEEAKEKILNTAIALKLAMNLYQLKEN